MKTYLLILFFVPLVFAQTYHVENITGKVKALTGTADKWTNVEAGMTLDATAMIMTEPNSTISLSAPAVRFTLRSSAALNVNNIRKMTLNDLLLALATEEILSAPRKQSDTRMKNTVIYGSPAAKTGALDKSAEELGAMRINGARQLVESGFEKSGVVAAKETFRQYPSTRNNIADRMYFANVLYTLKLNDEAYTEYSEILKLKPGNGDAAIVNERLATLKKKISGL